MYNVVDISLDVNNYRHQEVANDRDAIRELLANEKKHKVLDLAKDIVELGSLDPSARLIITPDKKNKGSYVVLEGNRRITALKTLLNPQLSEGLVTANDFRSLSNKFLKKPITQVECVELSPEEAQIWIKRKHYKGMGGASSVDWDAIARARSDAAEGLYTKWMTAVKFLDDQGYDVGYILEGIDEKSTTVERVLSSKFIHEDLGVTFSKNGDIDFDNGNLDAGADLLLAMFNSMIEPDFRETQVSTAEQQKKFISNFSALNTKGAKRKSAPSNKKDKQKPSRGPNRPQKKQRNRLAAKGLKIPHQHLNNLYVELERLPVETYTHCAAAMIRVFLEKSTVVYLKENKVQHPGGLKWDDFNIKLKDKIKAAISDIDPQKKNDSLNSAREIAAGNRDKIHTLDILNDYIHSEKSLPAPSELIIAWDRLHPYFDELFKGLTDQQG